MDAVGSERVGLDDVRARGDVLAVDRARRAPAGRARARSAMRAGERRGCTAACPSRRRRGGVARQALREGVACVRGRARAGHPSAKGTATDGRARLAGRAPAPTLAAASASVGCQRTSGRLAGVGRPGPARRNDGPTPQPPPRPAPAVPTACRSRPARSSRPSSTSSSTSSPPTRRGARRWATTWSTGAGATSPSDGRAARVAMLRRHRDALAAFGDDAPRRGRAHRPGHRARRDRAGPLRRGGARRARPGTRSSIVSMLGGGLFGILAREYAPWSQRGAALQARLERHPDARPRRRGGPDRPARTGRSRCSISRRRSSRSRASTSSSTPPSREAGTRAEAGEAADLVEPDARRPPRRATEAIAWFRERLDEDVRGRAEGEGRLGAELFARKLRLTLGSDLSPTSCVGARGSTMPRCAPRCCASRARSGRTGCTDEPLPEVGAG